MFSVLGCLLTEALLTFPHNLQFPTLPLGAVGWIFEIYCVAPPVALFGIIYLTVA